MTRLTVLAAALLLPTLAQAQYASTQPLYPYAVPADQPYAVEVAPNTYMIQRPAQTRGYPYVRCVNGCDGSAPAAVRERAPRRNEGHAAARRITHNDPALIEELRRRQAKRIDKPVDRSVKRDVINTTRIVRDPPVVIEHQRVVDDPPRIIERRHYVDDTSAPAVPAPRTRSARVEADVAPPRAAKDKGEKRVIRAEAEVTILGPDRMSIRLFRKRAAGAEAKAEADE